MSSYTIGIAGSGRMGADIFHYMSDYDFSIVWLCISGQEREKQQRAFMRRIDRLHNAGTLDGAARARMIEKTSITGEIRDMGAADIVIEAIPENILVKRAFFSELVSLVGRDAVLATNTSSIRPSLLLAQDMGRERFAGLHFFYPVKLKSIAEIIRTDHTNARSLEVLRDLLRFTGKSFLEMHESNGFVLNRIFLDLQAQAWRFCAEGRAGTRCMDMIVREDLFPSGVFEMFDAIGLDVVCASMENYAVYAADAAFYEPLIGELKRLVSLGRLGRKCGAGFYRYPDDGDGEPASCGEAARREISTVLRSLYINAACMALETGDFERNSLEYAIRECASADRGPFSMLDESGPETVRVKLADLYARTGLSVYRPSGLL